LSKSRIAPLEYARRWPLQVWMYAVLVFLYVPLLALMLFSFNDSKRTIVWKGFTFKHYAKLFRNEDLMVAFGNSLTIAFFCMILSLIIGTLAAVVLWRFRFRFKGLMDATLQLPIVIPEICMGVAMLAFFQKIGWPSGLPWPLNLGAIILAHVTFSFPFVTIVLRARLVSFNKEMEEGARDLGADDWQVFKDILIPHLKPGLIAGGLLAFTLSLDDFVITFFTSGPETVTFPVKVYSMVRFSVTPEVNAASTVLIILTVILTIIALRVQNRNNISAH
jgi:spermidine/putrescine transport system permease protein